MAENMVQSSGVSETVRDKTGRLGILILGMDGSGSCALARMFGLLGCDLPGNIVADIPEGGCHQPQSNAIARENDALLASAGSRWDDWLPIHDGWYASPFYAGYVARGADLLKQQFGDSPLFVLDDPRVGRIVHYWLDVYRKLSVDPAFVIRVGNPIDVAASLVERGGMEAGYGQLLWLRHILDAEAATRGRLRCFIASGQLLESWQIVAERVQHALGFSFPRFSLNANEDVSMLLGQEVRDRVRAPHLVLADPTVSQWLKQAYEIMLRWTETVEDPTDHAALDAVRLALDIAAPAFAQLIQPGARSSRRVGELEASLRGSVDDAQRIASEYEELKTQFSEVSNDADARGIEVERLKSVLAEIERDSAQADEKYSAIQLQLDAARADLARAEEQREDAHDREARRGSEMAELRQEVARSEGELSTLKGRQAELESNLRQRQEEIAQNWSELEAERLDHKAARARLDELLLLGEEKALVEARLSASQSELEDELRRRRAIEASVEGIESALDHARRQLQGRSVEIAALVEMVSNGEALQNELTAAREQIGRLEAQFEHVVNREREFHAVQAARETLERELRARYSDTVALNENLREERTRASRSVEQSEWMRAIVDEMIRDKPWWGFMPVTWQRNRILKRLANDGRFDGASYLAKNPDVENSGMDPLRHYILHGLFEGRSI